MEASLASFSLQESFKTSLISLPPELLLDIASHLPLGSLARFSLVSRFVRDAVQPKLYSKFKLWANEDTELKEPKRELIRSVLSSLASDAERCQLMREVELREWSWMGEVEMRDLELVLRHARRLKTLQLVSRSGSARRTVRAPTDLFSSPLPLRRRTSTN